jgi:hypothetical protein
MTNQKYRYTMTLTDGVTVNVVKGRGGYYFGNNFASTITGVYEVAATLGATVERHDNPDYQPRRRKQTKIVAPSASSKCVPTGLAEMLRI